MTTSDARRPQVVIVAPTDDAHACVVAKRLEALGAAALIVDSALFPSAWRLSLHTANGEPARFLLSRDGRCVEDAELSGVWWRRPQRFLPSPEVREERVRRFVTVEARAAFEGWLHCLGERVVNPIAADNAAGHKLLQLQCAARAGLSIPRSLATNDPKDVHDFIDAVGQDIIYKPFTAANWQLITTRRVSTDALQHLASVSYAPVIFQEEIRKAADIRANVLDGEVFAVSIEPTGPGGPIDWRADPARRYAAHELPAEVESSLVALVADLGLRFAACDLALTEDGRYVFFEANTGGQWLFAEIMVGQEISWAFARALLRERANGHRVPDASVSQ
ncbi:MvdC/MvdD family ATP grasp protein [Streptomyces sp. NPDC017949]|uniref:MvdC/MvdD family ATP grasp protein n=1 Tax=Streptomyces sp. NPDC017949 TaxID=3365020 RepID=UPI0037B78DEE